MSTEQICPSCHQRVSLVPGQTLATCPACGAAISVGNGPLLQGRRVGTPGGVQSDATPWDVKLRNWGIGLIIIGLIGLIMPLFGLQLRRLRNLGEAQWIVLCAITLVGCGAFAYSSRRKPLVAGGVSGVVLLLMTGLAFASFGGAIWGGKQVAGGAPPNSVANPSVPSAVPPQPEATPAQGGPETQSAEATKKPPMANVTTDPVELTGQIVGLLERTRNLLGSIVDVASATRAAEQLQAISQERDLVVAQLEAARPAMTQQQNDEIGRRYGAKLGQLGGEVALQMQRINEIPGVNEALQQAATGELPRVNPDNSAIAENAAEPNVPDPRLSNDKSSPSIADSQSVTPAPPQASPPPAEFENLPDVSAGLPPLAYGSDRIRVSSPSSPARANEFTDSAPPGGVLVGLRVIQGDSFGGAVDAIQPIYQTEKSYALGKLHGNTESPNARRLQVLAQPGWAVGQIQVRQGLVVNAVRLMFHPIRGKGLDLEQIEPSQWLGGEGGSEMSIGSPGAFVVGVNGSFDRLVLSLGVQQLQSDLEPPEVAFPQLIYARDRIEPSNYLGNNSGTEFSDQAPDGGILVGMVLSKGQNWGGALQAVQPIYQVQDRYELGQRAGAPGGNEVRVLARPGYAVGGLRIRSGLVLNAMQLVFMRLRGKQLDPRDTYDSEWVGADGGGPAEFLAGGKALAGVFGKHKEDLHGLGVGVVRQFQVRAELSKSSQARTWRSNDGKSTVEATLLEVVDGQASLRRADGRVIKVPLSRLSEEDQKYARSREKAK